MPAGADTNADLPTFGRVYRPRTALPAGSLADAFVHPHGFCRNVLATGALSTAGIATSSGGREMTLVRCDHPRSAKILVDRPDRWILVGADRETGMILLLEEHVGDELTRRAEVTSLSLDEPLGDEVVHAARLGRRPPPVLTAVPGIPGAVSRPAGPNGGAGRGTWQAPRPAA